MNTLVLEPSGFWERVGTLRKKIRRLSLKQKIGKDISETEIQDYQAIAREKIANILEYTLIEEDHTIHRDLINTVVKQEFEKLPVTSERDFVDLLEGRRVKNPDIRLWIASLVKKILDR